MIDEAALYRELDPGRIVGVLDVFGTEPLPVSSEWRTVGNSRISPHVAGHTVGTHRQQGQAMVDEVLRFRSGESLHHEVTAAMVGIMACFGRIGGW
jgi:phosphoglycerate dehydrogenase-like enzyme